MGFYNFRQNNTGGSFDYDSARGISVMVIVECDTREEAKDIGERIGLYWDGCDMGVDCPCCGDRWSEPYDFEDITDEPTYYDEVIDPNESVEESLVKSYKKWAAGDKKYSWFGSNMWMDGFEGFIHYKDGTIKGFWEGMPPDGYRQSIPKMVDGGDGHGSSF